MAWACGAGGSAARPALAHLQQLGRGARQLHPHALHAVAQLGADCLNDGDGAILVQVHLARGGGDGGVNESGRDRDQFFWQARGLP